MRILLLSGTGAMGSPLAALLQREEHDIYITSRSYRENVNHVHYIRGNVRELTFLRDILKDTYDVIFDFSVCSSSEFKERMPLFLDSTSQYFYFSSSRVYSDSPVPITEKSLRLLDSCSDEIYLSTDEYALAKAREENLLRDSGKKNWTIIRPYITYNDYRLQLGVYEKENWLNRVLEGKTIVLPKDIAEKKTALTWGPDVAGALVKLMGNEKAYGETFQIVTNQSLTWQEIFRIYSDVIERKTGRIPKIKYIENSLSLQSVWNPYQIIYDRVYNRTFDSRKLEEAIGKFEYTDMYEGLERCLSNFLDAPRWLDRNWNYETWSDVNTGEWTLVTKIPGKRQKLNYLRRKLFSK